MPPPPFNSPHNPITDPDRMLPPHKKSFGPVIGIVIILGLLIFGAFYSWGARLNRASGSTDQVTYIPAGTTTLPEINQ